MVNIMHTNKCCVDCNNSCLMFNRHGLEMGWMACSGYANTSYISDFHSHISAGRINFNRLRNRGSFLWLTGGWLLDFYWFSMEFVGNCGFGASPALWSVWCSPAVFFVRRKTTLLRKNMIFDDFQMIFYQNGPNLLLTRGTTIKTGILTPVEFWWVP